MTDMPTYEQFKWHLLGEAGGNLEVATAYGIARMHFPLKPGDEIAELVRNSLLELLRRGSHRFFRGDYSVGVDDVGPADRAEIADELERPDRGLDFARLLFCAGTEKGAGAWRSLPPGAAAPFISGNVPPES